MRSEFLLLVLVNLSISSIKATSLSFQDTREVTGGTQGNSGSEELLVLIPTNLNLTELPLNLNNFQLLKLSPDVLFERQSNNNSADGILPGVDSNENNDHKFQETNEQTTSGNRNGRKLNLLRGMWNKPKISPLYLVNGTVCRFVNAKPICTTLATTGLIPNNNINNNNFNNNNQGNRNSGQLPNVQQLSNNQQQNQQQQPYRPSAIMDDDSQDINVGASVSNVTDWEATQNQQVHQQPQRQQTNQYQVVRPLNFLVRRPVNILSLANRRRPVT